MRTPRLVAALVVVAGLVAGLAGPAAGAPGYTPQITNGRDASPGEYPFMVGLVDAATRRNQDAFFCGGSLISEIWVLTAAHCVQGATADDIDILTGTVSLADGGERVDVREIVVHPDWNDLLTTNDLALVRLASPVPVTDPVMVGDGTTTALEAGGTPSTLVGWGGVTSESDVPRYPTILQEAEVPIVSDQECENELEGVDTETIICAGAPEDDADGGIGSCYGDSGGPLLVTDPTSGRRVQLGVVSYGEDFACGVGLTAYTRLSAFEDWILDTTGTAEGVDVDVERLAGADRFATAASLATARWSPGVATAFVVTGASFADALASAPAAAVAAGPILLTAPDALPAATAAALRALEPEEIVVVGGEAAVGRRVHDELALIAERSIERVAGATRYDTAAALSRRTFTGGLAPESLWLASGEQFADALAGAAAAALTPAEPLLLTARATLPAATRAEIERLGPERVVVLGGPAAVSGAVVAAIEAFGIVVERLAGGDRYETAALVAAEVFGPSDEVVVATGLAFPDGLVAGALAAPVLLVPERGLPDATAAALATVNPASVLILGGSGSVPDATEQAIADIVREE